MRSLLLLLFCGVSVCSARVCADIVYLTNGATLEGKVTERGGKVIIERPNGTIVLPASRVERIEWKPCDLQIYEGMRDQIDRRAAGAAERFVELAAWCQQRNMPNQAKDCYTRALDLDPDCAAARTALGFTRFEGRWLTEDELARARGMVRHGDAWVTPEAKSDLVRLQAEKETAEAQARADRARAEVAVAEAERARAEAEALAARNRSYDPYYGGSYQYPVPYGYYVPVRLPDGSISYPRYRSSGRSQGRGDDRRDGRGSDDHRRGRDPRVPNSQEAPTPQP
jgi:hypothetical protein